MIFAGVFWRKEREFPEQLARAAAAQSLDKCILRLPQAIIAAPQNAVAYDHNFVVAAIGDIWKDKSRREPAEEILALLSKQQLDEELPHLNGAFAAAILDRQRNQWTILRDQLGQRMLYHTEIDRCCCFSESLPVLTALPGFSTEMDFTAFADFLSLGYIAAPRTIYESAHKTPPGCLDTGAFDGGKYASRRYWQPAFLPVQTISFAEAAEHAEELLTRAIGRRLLAHPTAEFMLSGGIDSGVVTGLAQKHFPSVSRVAHTVAFASPQYDESALAQGTADRVGVKLVKKLLQPEDFSQLSQLLRGAGEPYANSSLLPTAAALRATHSPALFTGDGGDEVFGGYRRYQAMLLRHRLPKAVDTALRPLAWIAASLMPAPQDNRGRLATLARSLHSLSLDRLSAYSSFQQLASPQLRSELANQAAMPNYLNDWRQLAADLDCADSHQVYNALDLMYYLPEDGALKCALAAAGTGVTLLSPLLDLDIVNFALTLPPESRFTSRKNKRLLRAIGKEFLAPDILTQTKRGFGTPVAEWFRGPLAKELATLVKTLPEWDHRKLINPHTAQVILTQHLKGNANHAPLLCALYALKVWEEVEQLN